MVRRAHVAGSSSPSVDPTGSSPDGLSQTQPRVERRPGAAFLFPRQRSPWFRILLVFALTVIIAGSVVGVLAWFRASAVPDWWNPPRADDPAVVTHAENFENRLVEQSHKVRPDDDWSVSIPQGAVNAWLAARLGPWIESRGDEWRRPDWARTIQINLEQGQIALAARGSEDARILGVIVEPSIDANGALWLRARAATVGTLELPAGLVADSLPVAGSELAKVRAMLRGELPVSRTPEMRLADGRAVRVVGLRIVRGAMVLTLRTAWPAPQPPA